MWVLARCSDASKYVLFMFKMLVKFSFSEKVTKICTNFLMVLMFTCRFQNHEEGCANFFDLLRKAELYRHFKHEHEASEHLTRSHLFHFEKLAKTFFVCVEKK